MDGSDRTYQVCDNVCYQMFRLQNVMYAVDGKTIDQQKALEFIYEYLNEQEKEENEGVQADLQIEQQKSAEILKLQ